AFEIAQQVLPDGERPGARAWLELHLHADEAVARLPPVEVLGHGGKVVFEVGGCFPLDLLLDGVDVVPVREFFVRRDVARIGTDGFARPRLAADAMAVFRYNG